MNSVRCLSLTIITFCLAVGISWLLLAQFNFAYDWFYTLIDIPQHITTYAPFYTERADFIQTTAAERSRLFAEVVTSIHQQGMGLAEISYYAADGTLLNTAFNRDEVIHLQDVANLIDNFKLILSVMFAVFVCLLVWMSVTCQALPPFKSLFVYVAVALLSITAVVLVIGPYEIFYQMHVWAFPEDHKWKFYYEESVMSNLMKAPDLFAYIAMLLVAVTIPIFVGIMWLVKLLLNIRSSHHV